MIAVILPEVSRTEVARRGGRWTGVMWRNVQGLRGIAVLLILFIHAYYFSSEFAPLPWLRHLAPIGSCGVDLFFVISGTIMVTAHWNDFGRRGTSLQFLMRRWARIYPLYWIVTLTVAAGLTLEPSLRSHWLGTGAALVPSLLLLPQSGGAPLLFAGWTLLYEMYFYYLFAAALRLRRRPAAMICACVGFGFAAVQLVPRALATPVGGFFLRNVMLEFFLGVVVGALVRNERFVAPRSITMLGVAGVVASNWFIVRVLHGVWHDVEAFHYAVLGVPMAALAYGAVGLERMRGAVLPRVVRALGDASYSIYLWPRRSISHSAQSCWHCGRISCSRRRGSHGRGAARDRHLARTLPPHRAAIVARLQRPVATLVLCALTPADRFG